MGRFHLWIIAALLELACLIEPSFGTSPPPSGKTIPVSQACYEDLNNGTYAAAVDCDVKNMAARSPISRIAATTQSHMSLSRFGDGTLISQ